MKTQIQRIDDERITIIETVVNERLILRKDLEAQKKSLQEAIAKIDGLLISFKEASK